MPNTHDVNAHIIFLWKASVLVSHNKAFKYSCILTVSQIFIIVSNLLEYPYNIKTDFSQHLSSAFQDSGADSPLLGADGIGLLAFLLEGKEAQSLHSFIVLFNCS